MDENDKKILEYLFLDSRLSTKKLAQLTGLQQPNVYKKLNKLEQKGFIGGYDSLLNLNIFKHKKIIYFTNLNEPQLRDIKKNKASFSIYPLFHAKKFMIWTMFKSEGEKETFESILPKGYKKFIIDSVEATGGPIFDIETKLEDIKFEEKPYKLSKEDLIILKILGKGGARCTLLELEEKTGLSIDVIRYRRKKLEKHGYFLRHITQPGKSFKSFKLIYVLFDLKKEINLRNFEEMSRIVTSISGKNNKLILSFFVEDLEDFMKSLENALSKLEGNVKRQDIMIAEKAILLNRYPMFMN